MELINPRSKMIVAALMLTAISGGCSKMTPSDVTVGGLPYSFPKSHINSLVRPEHGSLYVRLHPSGERFALLLHSKSDRQQKEQNTVIIPTINRSQFSNHRSVPTEVGEVICTNDFPRFNCGFELYDHEIRWSVVFDQDRISKVPEMKEEATRLLTSYRRGYADRRRAD